MENEIITFSTVVIAAAAIINLFVSCLMWNNIRSTLKINSDIFKHSYRPYLSISSISPIIQYENKIFNYKLTIENKGNVPANNLKTDIKVKINNNIQPVINLDTETSILFPNNEFIIKGGVDSKFFDDLISGKSTIEINLELQYSGINNLKYNSSFLIRYNSELKGFISIKSSYI